jgi:FkbM family methyltransferase
MLQKIVTSLARSLRPLKKALEDRIEESKFEQKVKQALKNPGFDHQSQIVRFNYEGKDILIKVPDPRDFISFTILSRNTFFDIHDLEALRDKIPAGGVVIDAGSNIGNHAVYYARICGVSRVYSFEPQEKIYALLQENVALNNAQDVIVPFKYALGDQPSRASADFQDDIVISGKKKQVNYGGLFLKEDSSGSFEVVTLDALLLPQLERLDFIKMDVQGFEPKVIKGARQVITRFKPVIQIECMEKKMLNEEIIPLMTELGYRITRVLEIDYLFEPVA